MSVNVGYYIENQLKNPLVRIFEPIIKDVEKELTMGEHYRNKFKSKVKSNIGMGKFVVIKKKCLGCGRIIAGGEATVCEYCLKKLP